MNNEPKPLGGGAFYRLERNYNFIGLQHFVWANIRTIFGKATAGSQEQWFTPSWAYHTRCKCLNTSATCRAYHHASLTALLMLSLSPFRPFITFKPKHGKSCNEHRHHEFLRAQPRQLKELCQWRHIQNRKQQYQS